MVDLIYFFRKIRVPISKFLERLHNRKFIKLVSINSRKEITGFLFAEVGFVGGDITKKRKIMAIHELGVDSSNRSTGFGTELMNEAIRIAKDKKCEEITLSVWSFNEKAISFYIKNHLEVQCMRMELKL